ncbi:hypothetical protein A1O1_09008 [Capronia coronata CBS 617.96]|uniref:Nuclear pore assembly and biogenesis-domain-containing protein n=1 Tax=Capronia coronata CBS 617.96 TaxID=1182541 RepID=W9XDQ5_9EURO|nr:uncharacterized protein A1O1_09008 [Capronia coronata CBS 617.96]EXJ78607.1 hypothetical protein A1O1_09008 [Capronia coronata CBS 617.96]
MPPSLQPLSSTLSSLTDLYESYIHPLLPSPLQAVSAQLTPLVTSTLNLASTGVGSALTAATNGDIVSLAAFLVVAYFSLRIADYVRRSVVAWVLFLVKIGLLFLLANMVVYVNRYGWERALSDAEWAVGLVWGFVADKQTGNKTGGWLSGARGSGGGNGNSWSFANGNGNGGGRAQVPLQPRGGRKRAGGWT